MQLVMSGIVLLAGLFVALTADPSSGFRSFGWVLVVVGAFGFVAAAVLRRKNRN